MGPISEDLYMLGKELLGPVHKCTQKYETEPLLCSSSQKILLGKVLVLYNTVHESRGTVRVNARFFYAYLQTAERRPLRLGGRAALGLDFGLENGRILVVLRRRVRARPRPGRVRPRSSDAGRSGKDR